MALFGLSMLFLGGMAAYSYYDEWKFRHAGDTTKTIGPQLDRTPASRDAQIKDGVNGFVGNGQQPIVQPDKTRQTLTRGGLPWANRFPMPPGGRQFADPGVDWFPPGRLQVGTYDPRNPATDGSMITSLKSNAALARAATERPEIMPHPDQEPLLHPQPLAGFINAKTHSNDGGMHSTSMLFDKRTRQFHDRSTTVVPTYVTPKEEHILSDNPSESHFWEHLPNSSHGLAINRIRPDRRDLVTQPVKASRGGPLQTRAHLRLVEINHRI